MATDVNKDKVGEKELWQRVYLHHAYDWWTNQKEAYFSRQKTNVTKYCADEEFAVHILTVHAHFCTEPNCAASVRSPSFLGRQNSPPGSPASFPHARENTSTSAYEQFVTVSVSIDDTANCQDALGDVIQHVPLDEESQGQDGLDDGFIRTEVKDEPEDYSEQNETGYGWSRITMESSAVSHDQQSERTSDVTSDIKYEENYDHQLEGLENILQSMETLPASTRTMEEDVPSRRFLTVLKSAVTGRKAPRCRACHKAIQRRGGLRRTTMGREDGSLMCAACQGGVGPRDRLPHGAKRDSKTKKPETNDANRDSSSTRSTNSSGEKLHTCALCPNAFHKKNDLNDHMRGTHTGERLRTCDPYSRETCTINTLSSCRRTSHDEKRWESSRFGSPFSQDGSLYRRMKSHTDERPQECTLCSKRFRFKSDLKRHMKTHTGIKPHRCLLCERMFSRNSDLQRHLTMHSVIKPYECSQCSKTFSQKRYLQRHLKKTHTGIKPHRCLLCERMFSRKSDLQRHLTVHSVIKPHKCSQCSKTFPQKRYLQRHLKTAHTGERSYTVNLEC